VAEARRDEGLPLYVACGGPLTNVAAAVRAAPDIAGRMTVLWIGGSMEEGRFEYNRDTDPALTDESSSYTASSTSGGAERRMYTDVDFRLLVGDMLAKFRRHGS
jgi:hypothetical protein